MSFPVPVPRSFHSNEQKKPIPTPRKLVSTIKNIESKSETPIKEPESNMNTFSRRVKTLSSNSKQSIEELAERVQEKKKAVIEGTRQSVRKITRRFTTVGIETSPKNGQTEEYTKAESGLTNIFDSLSFQSPFKSPESIYSNVEANVDCEVSSNCSFDDSVSLPPPIHPPPPLRENSIYDQPQSLASESSHSSDSNLLLYNNSDYESIFPSIQTDSINESYVDMNVSSKENGANNLTRSESWNFYDQVSKTENLYSNTESTANITNSEIIDSSVVNNNSHLEERNNLYENHVIKPPPRIKKLSRRAAESVILQFDPLNNVNKMSYANISDLKALEELLQGDLYGNVSNVGTYDNWSTSNESEVEEYINPPTPPVRFDSLPDENMPPGKTMEKSQTKWFLSESEPKLDVNKTDCKTESKLINVTKVNTESRASAWFKQVNEVLRKGTDNSKAHKQKSNNVVNRPTLSPKGVIHHRGMLFKITNGPVEDFFGEFSARWCVLENNVFTCCTDNTLENVKENYSVDTILSIQLLMDQKFNFKHENENLYCLEINISGKSRGGYVYGTKSASERRIWMQQLAESLTNRFSAKIISDYNRIGWAYIKEGVNGPWVGAWIVLSKRILYYAMDDHPSKKIDLRKVRYIALQNLQVNEFTPCTNDKGPNILIDFNGTVLYLRLWTTRETKAWCHITRLEAHNNGALLDEQQLTKNDIPVIVEKCINFIYAHGSMVEGIYRKPGSSITVQDILTKFRKDAYSVQLTSDNYTEHDVATALKRFFRDLPEPLLTTYNRQYLCEVSLVKDLDEKIRMFKALFDNFSKIGFKTVRKLLGHLHFITTQSSRNLMTVDNLAAVWGPTLMYCGDKENTKYGQIESSVVAQLIQHYKNIFPENVEEIKQEQQMLQVLERCLKSPQGPINTKASGDLRVFVHLHTKDGEAFSISLSPQKTAYEVCLELSKKIKLEVHELQLEELVISGNLIRPIHHTEKVLDVVLKWGYWEQSDRKDNVLVLSPILKYQEYIQEKVVPVSGELKFADSKSKTFKIFIFEFTQAKLSYYKDRACTVKIKTWNIEDLLWYIGHEPRRNAPTGWTITFMTKKDYPKRTKTDPWFGNALAFPTPALRASWLAAMLKAEYPKDLLPPPQHVNLLN